MSKRAASTLITIALAAVTAVAPVGAGQGPPTPGGLHRTDVRAVTWEQLVWSYAKTWRVARTDDGVRFMDGGCHDNLRAPFNVDPLLDIFESANAQYRTSMIADLQRDFILHIDDDATNEDLTLAWRAVVFYSNVADHLLIQQSSRLGEAISAQGLDVLWPWDEEIAGLEEESRPGQEDTGEGACRGQACPEEATCDCGDSPPGDTEYECPPPRDNCNITVFPKRPAYSGAKLTAEMW